MKMFTISTYRRVTNMYRYIDYKYCDWLGEKYYVSSNLFLCKNQILCIIHTVYQVNATGGGRVIEKMWKI